MAGEPLVVRPEPAWVGRAGWLAQRAFFVGLVALPVAAGGWQLPEGLGLLTSALWSFIGLVAAAAAIGRGGAYGGASVAAVVEPDALRIGERRIARSDLRAGTSPPVGAGSASFGSSSSAFAGADRPRRGRHGMLRPVRITSLALVCLALSVSCGAKSGLVIPSPEVRTTDPRDAGMDARDAGMDARDVRATCGPPVRLVPAHADVVLVLDRSGSMIRPLASSATTRWATLRSALGTVLPAFDADVALGAVLFPVPDASVDAGNICDLSGALEVPVALGAGPAVLSALDAHEPAGGTPTADAIAVATRALRARRRAGVPQSIVLCTDGGPNCDPADRGEWYFGLAPESCVEEGIDPNECLDSARTIARIDDALALGIPTYVIAMDIRVPYLVDVLRGMAVAGGRPRPGDGTPYYDVRNPAELTAALGDVATRVSSCSYFPEVATGSEPARVVVDGVPIERDDGRTEGWAPGPGDTIELFGEACRLAMRPGARVELLCE